MQTIELKSIDEGYFFQCGICNQFPEQAIECRYCNKLYCHTCSQRMHLQEKRGCTCKLKALKIMEPFQQYVYSRLTIKCQICKEVVSLNKSKKHQIKCQNKISNLELWNDKLFRNINIIQKNPFQIPCLVNHKNNTDPPSYKYQNHLNYQKYQLFQYQQNELFFSNLNEDAIIQLQTILFQCKMCQQEDNLFLMRHHHLFCKSEIVSCICGLNARRELLNDHIHKCLEEEYNHYKNQKSQISFTINLKQIAFNQQLMQNRHISYMISLTKQFQLFDQDFETWDQF